MILQQNLFHQNEAINILGKVFLSPLDEANFPGLSVEFGIADTEKHHDSDDCS